MSQINEALKRAQQSQKQPPSGAPPVVPPMPPVEPKSRGSAGWIVLLVAVACFFIGMAMATHKPAAETKPALAQIQTQEVQVPAAPPIAPKPIPPPPPPATSPVAVAAIPATVPAKPAPPALTLQGILMGSGKPQAIVNGQTVYVGDSVGGFRVQLISKRNVSLVAPDGSQKTLTLGE